MRLSLYRFFVGVNVPACFEDYSPEDLTDSHGGGWEKRGVAERREMFIVRFRMEGQVDGKSPSRLQICRGCWTPVTLKYPKVPRKIRSSR